MRYTSSTFPTNEVPGELERQRLEHECFAQSRIKGYVCRAGLFESLDKVLKTKTSSIRIVTGQSGCGKSALLAAWIEQARLPERTFVHYIGGTSESRTAQSIVLRLMETIRQWGTVSDRIPDDFQEAVCLLPEWLAMAAKSQKGGVLIVLDALDRLESEHDRKLWWLPSYLPTGVRLVASTLPAESEDELLRRGWLTPATRVAVPLLDEAWRREIIATYLEHFTEELDPALVSRLATAPQSGCILFLKVLLDELRIRTKHCERESKVERMLESKDSVDLFIQVLKELEELDKTRPNLLRDALVFLHVAKRSLTENELLQLLSEHEDPASGPLPMAQWSPPRLTLDELLVSHNGTLAFFHEELRQAVERGYLAEEWICRKIHGRLAGVALSWNTERFGQSLRSYGLAHGAYHLRQEDDHEKLWALLEDEGYRKAQLAEFKRVDETVTGLRHGIEVYAARNGETGEDDARLCCLVLRCGEVVQDETTSLQRTFHDFQNRPLDDPSRVEDALSRMQDLSDVKFYQACLLLLYLECHRSKIAGVPVSLTRAEIIVNAISVKVPDGTKITMTDWLEGNLVRSLPWKILAGALAKATTYSSPYTLLQIATGLEDAGEREGAIQMLSCALNVAWARHQCISIGSSFQKIGEASQAAHAFAKAQSLPYEDNYEDYSDELKSGEFCGS
jgi:hypothetical protein